MQKNKKLNLTYSDLKNSNYDTTKELLKKYEEFREEWKLPIYIPMYKATQKVCKTLSLINDEYEVYLAVYPNELEAYKTLYSDRKNLKFIICDHIPDIGLKRKTVLEFFKEQNIDFMSFDNDLLKINIVEEEDDKLKIKNVDFDFYYKTMCSIFRDYIDSDYAIICNSMSAYMKFSAAKNSVKPNVANFNCSQGLFYIKKIKEANVTYRDLKTSGYEDINFSIDLRLKGLKILRINTIGLNFSPQHQGDGSYFHDNYKFCFNGLQTMGNYIKVKIRKGVANYRPNMKYIDSVGTFCSNLEYGHVKTKEELKEILEKNKI